MQRVIDRNILANAICEKISTLGGAEKEQWNNAKPVRHLAIDNLLPDEFCKLISPDASILDEAKLSDTLKERKRVAQDLKTSHPAIHEALYAFQDPKVIKAIEDLLGTGTLIADSSLYAGGFSIMTQGDFLNPHLDNSHDGEQKLYRAINLLFYITPEWQESYGGNLELWEPGLKQRTQIHSKYNRLVIMETHTTSWHSVSKVSSDNLRCCVSNYYFSDSPLLGNKSYRHVTTFEARPEQNLRERFATKIDGITRNTLAKIFPSIVKHKKISKDE